MSYIRMDKGLPRKPKFRRLARQTGLSDHELVGYLFLIWSVVDEIGQDLEGTDEDIACAVCAPSALVCALCAVGWATRFDGGITFNTNDPTTEDRTNAHRARAARSYDRKKGVLRADKAQTAQTAPPSIHPIHPSNLSNLEKNTAFAQNGAEVCAEIEAELVKHRPPNATLNYLLTRDPIIVALWESIPRKWAKEPDKNRPKLAAAVTKLADEQGIERTDAANQIRAAIAGYAKSDEGQGKFARSLTRWLDNEGWREDPESWKGKQDTDDEESRF